MLQRNIQDLYSELKKAGSPHFKNKVIESLEFEEAISLLKRVFYSVVSDPANFSPSQKFLALSLDYETNLLYAEVSTGFRESIDVCVDSTTLYKPNLKKFLVLLFKLPETTKELSEFEAKKSVANISSSGISPEDLFVNSEYYELVHVSDLSFQ
ncbi:hypothetical protein [Paenibacillus polymyxa]|uniref:hypothetical protein n=1 Tax=Paenibacillus polymyxa TaxID=1406 RepID=UPI00021BBBA0|nr:hypothetical protein [Paenibacillus polymyxa]MDN4106207.1 hypothetical protein [Paenibacillus polymyxa]CCC86330.1 hypothetical protein PPM_p0180 [Paenibacillus polymyxa M1]